jgi:hypothetical protein
MSAKAAFRPLPAGLLEPKRRPASIRSQKMHATGPNEILRTSLALMLISPEIGAACLLRFGIQQRMLG